MLLVFLVNLTPVQTFLARKAAAILSDKLKTRVEVKAVRIDFLNHVRVQGLYVEDTARDTLLYAGEASARITDWFLFRREAPVLRYVGLKDAYAHLYRTTRSDVWNYQFIVDAFDTGPQKKKTGKTELELDLEKIVLQQVRFHMDDAWGGSDYDIDVGSLLLDADELNIQKKLLAINVLEVSGLKFHMRDYEVAEGYVKRKKVRTIDLTPFNKELWVVKANKLSLENCRYIMDMASRPAYENEFDPMHMDVSDINILVENIAIDADTITGNLKNLSAKERCGFEIKKLTADVSVSPVASICNNLYLETNRSKIQRYYAMHYDRFPDFEEYVDKVRMSADFRNAIIDNRDIAFFAPMIHDYRATLLANGVVNGSVDSLVGKKLNITDGSSKLVGDLVMKGLPDIYNTFISFSNGEIFTTENAIFKYMPALRDFRTVDIAALDYVHFKGSYIGYLESFITQGTLSTALGAVTSNIHLKMPDMNPEKANYSGTLSSASLDVGKLFRQPGFGKMTFSLNIEGSTFDPKNASVKLDGDVEKLEFNGYTYTDINAAGILAQKKFDGKLLINDPNLALAFYGNADFSQPQLQIKATANLLSSSLKPLNFTKDSLTLAADFDLDYTGNNIDEFIGSAKLYNINLVREGHQVDIDSVYLRSDMQGQTKLLVLESNILRARVEGNYLLSRMPYSFQYYIAGYLPAYIETPTEYAPNQVLDFEVQTHEMDSLFAVILPGMQGFNHAAITGSLNTNTQQLTFNAHVPYGYVYGIHFDSAAVNAAGDFDRLTLDAHAKKLALGKDLVSASFEAHTTLGNDSLSFNIATESQDDYGTAKIAGKAYAYKDSLYLQLEPSEFFLNKYLWEIPAGNEFVFAKDYLRVTDFIMRSGDQQVAVNSANEYADQAATIAVKDFDLTMLGNLADIALYEPSGRLNGTISVRDIYRGMKLQSDLLATDVKFGQDTIGTVTVVGSYDAKNEVVTLDPKSGIRHNGSSLIAGGSISLDSTNNQLLNGYVQLEDADVNWIRPFVSDFLSRMSGKMNGRIKIGGSAAMPDVEGSIKLTDAATKIDVIGTYYRIPAATVTVDNDDIDFGRITVYDDYDNTATLTGGLRHERFRNIRFNNVMVTSPKFEVLNLSERDNTAFYGNLIANVSSLTFAGTIDDIRMNIRATPAEKSHIFIPVQSGTDINTYSYITFKQYGEEEIITKKKKNKFSFTLAGDMNPLAELTMVLDPATGDLINAKGYGNITLSLPANEDMKMYGNYEIDEGDYTFTFRKLFFVRNFKITEGSRIAFNGPLDNTNLNINGVYATKVRPADLLTPTEKSLIAGTPEGIESNSRQDINILLSMTGSLDEPKLNFKLDLDKRFEGSMVSAKLVQINQNYATLFDQVASLLLVGTFIPTEGLFAVNTNAAVSNNFGEILSSTFSSQLTNMVSKLLNDPSLAIELKYNNYSYNYTTADQAITSLNRNEVSLGIRKNFLKDRLVLEVGSAYDWGRPTATNSAAGNLNLAGDFRAQYLLTEDGRVRLNAFRTSAFDVFSSDNVYRAGLGISYRKSFNSLKDFFGKKERPKLPQVNDSLQNVSPTGNKTTAL
ncbi:MAG TPA: translocation/assembly module TamB domain-containing protein [Flavipsychrobacter sp.]|nr:translocation/assembly module TamB domain-containing protein [Flavipsychrobacter sp.]